jgi:aryl-alcohol dehydrogenase-like predicted oxidoreductase
MGTWQIGGPMTAGTRQMGWGPVNDEESVNALRRAVELGVTLFDTADAYGAGHAERVLSRALGDHRDELVWATKWGVTFDEMRRERTGFDPSPSYARRALEASLRRLDTDRVDLWLLHLHDLSQTLAEDLVDLCEKLIDEGLIRAYGWSTDDPARANIFAQGSRCAAIEHYLNVLDDDPEMLALCHDENLASIDRSPLAMGLLSHLITAETMIPPGDIRHDQPAWLVWFNGGRPTAEFLARRDAIRHILTEGGRTLSQGALAWIWARSDSTIPIPGCRTVAEIEENAAAMEQGALTPAQLDEVEAILRPEPPGPTQPSDTGQRTGGQTGR